MINRNRSIGTLSDAASALVGLAGSPEGPAPRRQKVQHSAQGGKAAAAGSNWAVPRAAREAMVATTGVMHTAHAYSHGGTSSDDDATSWAASSMDIGDSLAAHLAAGLTERSTAMPRPMYSTVGPAPPAPYHARRPPVEPAAMSDAQLLTSASVLLACCGLTHALNVTAEGDGDGGPPALSNSPSRDTTTDGEETDAFESPCGSRELHAAPLGAIKRSAHSTPERSEDTQSEPSQGHQRFSESVWSILRDECTHVHALGRNEFARLCQLLDLPLETCAPHALPPTSASPPLCPQLSQRPSTPSTHTSLRPPHAPLSAPAPDLHPARTFAGACNGSPASYPCRTPCVSSARRCHRGRRALLGPVTRWRRAASARRRRSRPLRRRSRMTPAPRVAPCAALAGRLSGAQSRYCGECCKRPSGKQAIEGSRMRRRSRAWPRSPWPPLAAQRSVADQPCRGSIGARR